MSNPKAKLIIANNLSKEVERLKTGITTEECDLSIFNIKKLTNILSNNKAMLKIEDLATQIEKYKSTYSQKNISFQICIQRFAQITYKDVMKSHNEVLVKIELYHYERRNKSNLLKFIKLFICQYLGYALLNFKINDSFFLKITKNGFASNHFNITDFFPESTKKIMLVSGLDTIFRLENNHHRIFKNVYKLKKNESKNKKNHTKQLQQLEKELDDYIINKAHRGIASF